MKHKYIRIENVGIILFPDQNLLTHKNIGEQIENCGLTIISAGFANIHAGEVRCFGESISLGIGSIPIDTEILARQLGFKS